MMLPKQRVAWLGLLLLIAGAALPVQAGFQIPPQLEKASEEQQRAYIQRRSQLSLEDKLRAGRRRDEERKALRSALAAGMQLNFERRRQALLGNEAVPATAISKDAPSRSTLLSVLAALAVGGSFLFRRRQTL